MHLYPLVLLGTSTDQGACVCVCVVGRRRLMHLYLYPLRVCVHACLAFGCLPSPFEHGGGREMDHAPHVGLSVQHGRALREAGGRYREILVKEGIVCVPAPRGA